MARQPVIDRSPPAGAAAVHALVLGVGRYANGGLAALDGAAPSALAFADWVLTKHKHPAIELGSLDILASQPSGAPVPWQTGVLDAPTLANVKSAVDGWHARANENRDNLAVFYFCGHGVELGMLQILMLEDVDLMSQTDPFNNAIGFNSFVHGMDSCGARQQLFVLDACRELPAGLARWDDDVTPGNPLVRFNLTRRTTMTPRTHVVLHAAASTQKAWSGGERGWFTDALLAVLDGAAGRNSFSPDEHTYPVNTRDIADTINFLVTRDFLVPPAGPQTPVRKGEGDFDLHVPAVPAVPVVVTRKPPTINTGAQFVALQRGAQVASHACPDERPWRSRLGIGDYVFQREGDAAPLPVKVTPPARKVEMP